MNGISYDASQPIFNGYLGSASLSSTDVSGLPHNVQSPDKAYLQSPQGSDYGNQTHALFMQGLPQDSRDENQIVDDLARQIRENSGGFHSAEGVATATGYAGDHDMRFSGSDGHGNTLTETATNFGGSNSVTRSNTDGHAHTDTYTATQGHGASTFTNASGVAVDTGTKTKPSDSYTQSDGHGHTLTRTETNAGGAHTATEANGVANETKTGTKGSQTDTSTDGHGHVTTSTDTKTGHTSTFTTDDQGHILTVTKTGRLVSIDDGGHVRSHLAKGAERNQSAQQIASGIMIGDAQKGVDKAQKAYDGAEQKAQAAQGTSAYDKLEKKAHKVQEHLDKALSTQQRDQQKYGQPS